MNRIRIGRPRARALSPDPPDSDIVRAKGARAGRAFRKGARDMIAWAGRRLWLAAWTVIRAVKMAHDEQVRMWECVLLTSGAAPLTAAGPLRWVRVAGRLPARRQPPAGPGPERNGAVTRAGGRGPRSRPRRRPRIRQGHPEPPDRHQPRREPSVMSPHGAGPPASGPRHRGRTRQRLTQRLAARSRRSFPASPRAAGDSHGHASPSRP